MNSIETDNVSAWLLTLCFARGVQHDVFLFLFCCAVNERPGRVSSSTSFFVICASERSAAQPQPDLLLGHGIS